MEYTENKRCFVCGGHKEICNQYGILPFDEFTELTMKLESDGLEMPCALPSLRLCPNHAARLRFFLTSAIAPECRQLIYDISVGNEIKPYKYIMNTILEWSDIALPYLKDTRKNDEIESQDLDGMIHFIERCADNAQICQKSLNTLSKVKESYLYA